MPKAAQSSSFRVCQPCKNFTRVDLKRQETSTFLLNKKKTTVAHVGTL